MAEAIAGSGINLRDIRDGGFYVVAPPLTLRAARKTNLEAHMSPASIRATINERISGYETASRTEADGLRDWERQHFIPLLDRLVADNNLAVLSWDDCIEAVRDSEPATADELHGFYQRCLELAAAQTDQR